MKTKFDLVKISDSHYVVLPDSQYRTSRVIAHLKFSDSLYQYVWDTSQQMSPFEFTQDDIIQVMFLLTTLNIK